MDEIRIEDLDVYAYHGVYPEENEKGQHFFVNARLFTNTRPAGLCDDLTLSTNYGEVCHFINQFMKEHTFKLIETVAEKLAEEILTNFTLLDGVELEIRKPEAPIGLPFRSVSVCIERKYTDVYLSVGSNMGDKYAYINEAYEKLKNLKGIRNVKMSNLLVTKPYGGVEQDDFVNGAISLQTYLSPAELLDNLHKIEAEANRERLVHWGPRTLDLDIVFYGKNIYEDENLIIPHIDMQNRYFVLKPLSELIPNFRHPILNKTVSSMLEELS